MQKPIITCIFMLSAGSLLLACNDHSEHATENKALKDSLEAVSVLDTITHIPDVTDRKKLIEGNSGGRRTLSAWIAEKPGKHPFYSVAVGEDSGKIDSDLHFNFHVYPAPIRIFFYDELNQREVPLDEWRAQNK